MVSVLACALLGALLVAAAGLKLADGHGTRTALATYGLTGQSAHVVWAALICVEGALGVLVAAGLDRAAYAAALLFAVFAAAQAVALMSGRAGAPCACLGAGGRVGRGSLARAALAGAAFAALPLLPRDAMSTDAWLALGLGVALLAVAGLGVVVLAMARELGALRLRLGPEGALEIAHEGPEVGGRTGLAEHFDLARHPERVGLAVFTSEGCGLCRALAPAVRSVGRDALVELHEFDEAADAEAWALADVPGSPFAVALGADGTVLAKGTFNSGGQLESVVAAALRRRDGIHA